MLRESHRLKKKQDEETLSYKILMCIPRNLVYVFLFAIILAFLGMLFVIYTEKDLSSFVKYSE